jgi:hypothetical protein
LLYVRIHTETFLQFAKQPHSQIDINVSLIRAITNSPAN